MRCSSPLGPWSPGRGTFADRSIRAGRTPRNSGACGTSRKSSSVSMIAPCARAYAGHSATARRPVRIKMAECFTVAAPCVAAAGWFVHWRRQSTGRQVGIGAWRDPGSPLRPAKIRSNHDLQTPGANHHGLGFAPLEVCAGLHTAGRQTAAHVGDDCGADEARSQGVVVAPLGSLLRGFCVGRDDEARRR